MSPPNLLTHLTTLFPRFKIRWVSKKNISLRIDGSFTHCGVLSEFSHYFTKSFGRLKQEPKEQLFHWMDEVLEQGRSEDLLEKAIKTCFLENLIQTPIKGEVDDLLGPKTRDFVNSWNRDWGMG